jgi:hypothetical protein
MADLSFSLAKIKYFYSRLDPAEKVRTITWCQRCIERAGCLDTLQRLYDSYPKSGQWWCVRQLLPNEAIPILENHLESLDHAKTQANQPKNGNSTRPL